MMYSEIDLGVTQQEMCLANIVIDLIKMDKSDSKSIIDKYYTSFTKITKVRLLDSDDFTPIPTALIVVQSDVLAGMCEYSDNITVPKLIYEIITFTRKDKITGMNIITALIDSDQYNINIDEIVDWSTLSADDLDYYVMKYKCYGIEKNRFGKLKSVIAFYVLESSAYMSKVNVFRCKCIDCLNSLCQKTKNSDGIFHLYGCKHYMQCNKHKIDCKVYKRYVQFPRIFSSILNYISYDEIVKTRLSPSKSQRICISSDYRISKDINDIWRSREFELIESDSRGIFIFFSVIIIVMILMLILLFYFALK
jgi:hypothetical protein